MRLYAHVKKLSNDTEKHLHVRCSVEVGGSIDDLQRNRTNLNLYGMRVQIHKEDVIRRTLMVEREILLRKCALKENKKNRKRRAVCI